MPGLYELERHEDVFTCIERMARLRSERHCKLDQQTALAGGATSVYACLGVDARWGYRKVATNDPSALQHIKVL